MFRIGGHLRRGSHAAQEVGARGGRVVGECREPMGRFISNRRCCSPASQVTRTLHLSNFTIGMKVQVIAPLDVRYLRIVWRRNFVRSRLIEVCAIRRRSRALKRPWLLVWRNVGNLRCHRSSEHRSAFRSYSMVFFVRNLHSRES